MYLNITDWPANNKIALYGLKSKIYKAYTLAGKKSVNISKEGPYTVVELPNKPTDPYVSVIALEVKGKVEVEDALVQKYDGSILLETEAAENNTGAKIRFGSLSMYNRPKGNIKWDFEVVKPGKYKLEAITTGRKRMSDPTAPALFDQGHLIELNLNGTSSQYTVNKDYVEKAPKDLYNNFKVTTLGEVELKEGKNSIVITPKKIVSKKRAGFSLRQVRFIPIN